MKLGIISSLLGLSLASSYHPLVQSFEPYTDENGVTYTYDEDVQDWYYTDENGDKIYMQNIIDDDENADFEEFYEYEGQYTEF